MTNVTLLDDDFELELVRLDEGDFDVLELDTLDEDDDLEVLVVPVADSDFDVVEVDDGFMLEGDFEVELVKRDEGDFDELELETLEEDDLERLVVIVVDGDFEVVEVDNGFVLVVKLDGVKVLLLDEADESFEEEELNDPVNDLVEAELDTLDDFNEEEPDRVEDEDNSELDFVPDWLVAVGERALELPEVEGLLEVRNPEEVTLKLGETEALPEVLLRLDAPLLTGGSKTTAWKANAALALGGVL